MPADIDGFSKLAKKHGLALIEDAACAVGSMYKGKKIVAIIPARGGSKSIPYKNIKEIAGKPLVYWVCEAAKKSKYIDEIYISSEDQKIKEILNAFRISDFGFRI